MDLAIHGGYHPTDGGHRAGHHPTDGSNHVAHHSGVIYGWSAYHAVSMTLRVEGIMVGIALPDHKRNTWIRHQTSCWTSPYFVYGTQT